MDMGIAVEILEYWQLHQCWQALPVMDGRVCGCPAGLSPWQGSWQLLTPRRGQPGSPGADWEFLLSGPGRKMLHKSQGSASSLVTLSSCWHE